MTWFDDLHQRVADQGQRPHVLPAGQAGGRLLIAEHGARVLACELPGVDHNLFFHTDRTGDGGAQGPITGGDRLWIAPETAFFWPSLDDARRDPKGTARTPVDLDPGDYRPTTDAAGDGLTLHADMALRDRRPTHAAEVAVHVTRSVSPPRRLEAFARDGLAVLTFSIANRLSVVDPETLVGSWDILQVPVGGTLLCPTTIDVATSDRYTAGDQSHGPSPDAGPRSYYDAFGDRHVQVQGDCVRFLIDGQRRTKMGLLPEHTTGRMGYYRQLGQGRSSLIFRSFNVFPGEPYCDLPINHPAHDAAAAGEDHPERTRGDALQAYNDDGEAFPGTSFGEMEYHDPACGPGRDADSMGQCTTYVMAGPDAAIQQAGRELLGVAVRGIGESMPT
jgi:hypothetical protein